MEEEIQKKWVSLKGFYLRRVLRVLPAYYFLFLVYFVLQISNIIKISKESWLTAVTFTQDLTDFRDWVFNHTWSLSVEEQFYLFWPLTFVRLKKFRPFILFGLVIMVVFVRIAIAFKKTTWINGYSFFARIDGIAIGCLFAIYREQILTILKKHFKLYFYISIAILFLIKFLVNQPLHLAFIFTPFGTTNGLLANLPIAVIMMYSIYGNEKGLWFSFLNNKWVNFIGLLSYSLYLWQQFFCMGNNLWCTTFPYNLLCLYFAALFSYFIIEKPFLSLKNKFQHKVK